MSSTTLTSWALLIWKTLQEKGEDPRPFFKKAELDVKKLGDGSARYPAEKIYRLWHSLEVLDDPYLGLSVGQNWNPTTFHALGFAWLACDSLAHAMHRLTRYSRLVNNSLYSSFNSYQGNYLFEITTSENPKNIHPFGADAGAAAILKMTRMLCGESFSPMEVHAVRGPDVALRRLEDMYRCPIVYNSTTPGWIINRMDAEQHIASGNSELARINEQIADKALLRLDKQNISGRIKQKIIEMLPSGDVDEEKIAADLGLSVRTMQRKLNDEQLSFSKMVADIRESLAKHYINEAHLSLSEISYLLGFAEQASFTRAFKRWTGKSPSLYRKQAANTIAA